MRRHTSIQKFGRTPSVRDADRLRFETAARNEGLTNYEISGRSADRRPIPAEQRDEYFPNFFLEPPPATAATYGLDQASDQTRRDALALARDTGELVFSERIELALVADNRSAILAYAPVYRGNRKPATVEQRREQLAGYAYGVVRPSAIVEVMLKDRQRGMESRQGAGMQIDIYDTTEASSPRFLFSYRGTAAGPLNEPGDVIAAGRHDFVNTASFGGREWTFIARPTTGVLGGNISWQTGLAFGASLILSLLLAAYLHTVNNRARLIEAEVSLRTNELRLTNDLLRDSEDRIRVITNSLPALIAYVDRNLIYRFANERYREIGVDPDSLIGKSAAEVRRGQSFETIRPYFERAANGESLSFEITADAGNGQTRYSVIDCTPDIVDGIPRGFYLLGRDVTAERNAERKIQRANDLLRSSEERLRVITNSLPALIAHVDRNMCIQYMNERFAILSIDFDNPMGKPLETVIGPEKGEVRGFYFVALNVTAQRALEIELDRFFRQSLSFMWVATFDGFLRRFNDTWKTVLGYTHDELVSTPYIRFIHPDDRAKAEAALERLQTGRDLTNLEIRMVAKDGTERFILWNAAANGQERQIYATGHDITDLKAVDRMKDEFVSTVSHELRTPLTSIKGALGLMRAKTLGTLPADMNMMLDIAYKNCDRLVLLINDILDIEKIEAGKMDFKFEPVDIMSIVRNALAANQAYADQFGVTLSLGAELEHGSIRADEGRIMQVLANLLSNAAKFSPENGKIEIRVERHGRLVRVSIEDHGPGIPEDFRSRIFEKFSQNDSSDRRKVSGTGLGLSIVRAIVERHGGRIDFDTEIGKGSTFYFEIPELIVNQPIDAANGLHRILICEDDPDVAEILRGIIERCGYSADIALSAAQAKALLDVNAYAGMTLDIMLPDMNGVDFFKQLRATPRTRLLPIIIVSAKAAESVEKINGSAINVVDWLDKPLDEERMANAVKSAIAMSAGAAQRILHVEDDSDLVQVVGRQVGNEVSFMSAGSLAAARQLLGKERFDLVILDLILPDGRGEDLLPLMVNPDGAPIPVIVFSAIEAPVEIAERVEAVLVKTRSTDQMLTEAIDAFVTRNNLVSQTIDDRTSANG
ncbi:MAG: sensor hybrid histidine kinase [Rhodospirillales bacterium]|nr:sensor hybrid histidine kinase [Rhodospirillales bacterium]